MQLCTAADSSEGLPSGADLQIRLRGKEEGTGAEAVTETEGADPETGRGEGEGGNSLDFLLFFNFLLAILYSF